MSVTTSAMPTDLKLDIIPYAVANKPASKHDINEMRRIADHYGGKCLSTSYTNNYTPLRWKCCNEHYFQLTLKMILRSHWCPACRKLQKEAAKLARKRKGASSRTSTASAASVTSFRSVQQNSTSQSSSQSSSPEDSATSSTSATPMEDDEDQATAEDVTSQSEEGSPYVRSRHSYRRQKPTVQTLSTAYNTHERQSYVLFLKEKLGLVVKPAMFSQEERELGSSYTPHYNSYSPQKKRGLEHDRQPSPMEELSPRSDADAVPARKRQRKAVNPRRALQDDVESNDDVLALTLW